CTPAIRARVDQIGGDFPANQKVAARVSSIAPHDFCRFPSGSANSKRSCCAARGLACARVAKEFPESNNSRSSLLSKRDRKASSDLRGTFPSPFPKQFPRQ